MQQRYRHDNPLEDVAAFHLLPAAPPHVAAAQLFHPCPLPVCVSETNTIPDIFIYVGVCIYIYI